LVPGVPDERAVPVLPDGGTVYILKRDGMVFTGDVFGNGVGATQGTVEKLKGFAEDAQRLVDYISASFTPYERYALRVYVGHRATVDDAGPHRGERRQAAVRSAARIQALPFGPALELLLERSPVPPHGCTRPAEEEGGGSPDEDERVDQAVPEVAGLVGSQTPGQHAERSAEGHEGGIENERGERHGQQGGQEPRGSVAEPVGVPRSEAQGEWIEDHSGDRDETLKGERGPGVGGSPASDVSGDAAQQQDERGEAHVADDPAEQAGDGQRPDRHQRGDGARSGEDSEPGSTHTEHPARRHHDRGDDHGGAGQAEEISRSWHSTRSPGARPARPG